jgi:dihydroneopterin aldolase
MLTGLAGSLTIEDIPTLLEPNPDYIGFRTALCNSKLRTGTLNKESIRSVREQIPEPESLIKKLA